MRSRMRNRYGSSPGDHLSKMLQCPLPRGMSGDVKRAIRRVPTSMTTKTYSKPKAVPRGDEKIAPQNPLGLVADKGHPTLRGGAAPRSRIGWQVASDRPREIRIP